MNLLKQSSTPGSSGQKIRPFCQLMVCFIDAYSKINFQLKQHKLVDTQNVCISFEAPGEGRAYNLANFEVRVCICSCKMRQIIEKMLNEIQSLFAGIHMIPKR